jgi:hypothetical protein
MEDWLMALPLLRSVFSSACAAARLGRLRSALLLLLAACCAVLVRPSGAEPAREQPASATAPATASALRGSLLLAPELMAQAPCLLPGADGRRLFSAGSEVLARGQWPLAVTDYAVLRRLPARLDQSARDVSGMEVLTIGVAELLQLQGEQGLLRLGRSRLEIRPGDCLLPRDSPLLQPLAPGQLPWDNGALP